ncbi:RNA-binding protein, partial [Virgibacillus profundi]
MNDMAASPSEPAAATADQAWDERLTQTFVGLADTLVDEFDLLDFLWSLVERSVYLLDVSEAGVVLADPGEGLRVAAASSERVQVLELLAVQA